MLEILTRATSGTVLWAISSGEGKFVKVGPRRDLPPLAFIVEKDRILKKITIEITSMALRQTLHRAILDTAPSSASLHLDFETLLQNYEALKLHLYRLQCQRPHSEVTMEAGLLISDLLLESNLYDGIGMEGFRQRKVLCANHIRDIHQRNLDLGLDEIQDYFALGLIPDCINAEYMEALNEKYALLARSGDLHALQNLCEPIVRSGEISMQYNPSLLVEVLENEDFEIYQYMLALVERTRDEEEGLSDQLPDVTFDPFHVAIRLGRLEIVQNFISENAYFEGRVAEHSCFGVDCLITPLTSSVLWQRPDITRLLLASGPLYLSSYAQAVELAFSSDFREVQQVLSEFSAQSTSTPMALSSFGIPSSIADTISPMAVDSPDFQFFSEHLEHNDQEKHDRDQALSTLVEFPSEDISFPPMDPTFASNDIDPQMLMAWGSVDTLPTELSPTESSPPFKHTASQFESPDAHVTATEVKNPPAVTLQQTQPFARQTSSYTARRKAGQSITQRLEAQFVRMRNLCNERRQDGEYLQLLQRMSGLEEIWSTGIRTFKGIYRNRPPEDLYEMLCCLLVADAMSMQASLFEYDIHSQSVYFTYIHISPLIVYRFVSDISRWRTVVNDDDKHVFDEVCFVLWQVDNLHTFADTDELSKIQDFIQDLVSIDKVEARLPQRPSRQGSRLRTIYDRKGKQKEVCNCAQRAPCMESLSTDEFPSLDNALSLSSGAHQDSEDLIDLSDFIYLDAPGVENMEDEHFAEPNSSRKDFLTNIKPTVVLLLASVAFSIILSFISGKHPIMRFLPRAIADSRVKVRKAGVLVAQA